MRGYCVKEKPTASSRSGEGDQLPQQPRLPSVESLNQATKSLRSNIVPSNARAGAKGFRTRLTPLRRRQEGAV
jgi:hypothetical protein